MRRLIITGARGQLGAMLTARRPTALALGSTDLDITDSRVVDALIAAGDVVLNCAAYTAVDRAETDVAAAFAVNETGPQLLARACARVGARLIHVSTDFVFDGQATEPYDIDAQTGPVNVYGESKLAGERAVRAELPEAQVIRTAWVHSGAGTDFVSTMLRKVREGATVRVVTDRIGSPTYADDLAVALLELVDRPDAGLLLHAAGAGVVSWYDVARAVFEDAGADPDRVTGCLGVDYPTPAARPDYTALSGRAWTEAGLSPLPHWRDGVAAAVRNAGAESPAAAG